MPKLSMTLKPRDLRGAIFWLVFSTLALLYSIGRVAFGWYDEDVLWRLLNGGLLLLWMWVFSSDVERVASGDYGHRVVVDLIKKPLLVADDPNLPPLGPPIKKS